MVARMYIKPVAAAVLLAVVANGPVLADTSIKEQVMVAPGLQISPRGEAVISSAAVKALRHIAAAGQSKPDIKAKVQDVASLVQGLEKGIGSGDRSASDAAAFLQAEAQLATLIRQL